MIEREAAPGIHRVESNHTNFYVVEEDGRRTVVDAGIPISWPSLVKAVGDLGTVEALILTHAHFDHIGIAERIRDELGAPVYVHENDVPLTMHPTRYGYERSPLWYVATKPKALPIVLGFLAANAFFPRRIKEVQRSRTGRSTCRARRASSSRPGTRSATSRSTGATAPRRSPSAPARAASPELAPRQRLVDWVRLSSASEGRRERR